MLHAIRVTLLSLVVLASLYACGGQSSGESTDAPPTNNTPATITPPSTSDAVSGKAFYEQSALGCIGCHGVNGEGGVFNAINTVAPGTCPSCTDLATLASVIAATMPTGANTSLCTGTTSGSCAHDIAAYMMESWINTSTPPVVPTPGITVEPTANISTSEDATSATFSIRLDSEPTSDVNINISIDDITEGTINPANLITLTFDNSNWNINQSVTVTGVDDGDIDGPISYTAITSQVITADIDYMGMNPADVTIINTDNEVFIPAGITVTPINGLTTSENVTTTTFSVSLDTMPTNNVTIGISSMDVTEGTVSPASLVFTNLDFNAKTVTVTGVDDGIQDGPQAYMIVTAPAISTDPEYSNRDASDVSVTNIDNEAGNPGVLVTPTMGLMTTEAGGTASYAIVLQSMPNAAVSVAVASSNTLEGTVDKATLNFDGTNWDTAQTVTVTGIDDAVFDLNQAYEITNTITSIDPAYTGLANITVSATNQDDEENLFALGKVAYEAVGNNCALCHGASGEGTVIFYDFIIGPVNNMCGVVDCLNEAELTTYIEAEMPPGNEGNCDATCASNIAKYMLNNFSVAP
jgi:mono/diheme cytochrome c family protein